jgi:hypothetical protein
MARNRANLALARASDCAACWELLRNETAESPSSPTASTVNSTISASETTKANPRDSVRLADRLVIFLKATKSFSLGFAVEPDWVVPSWPVPTSLAIRAALPIFLSAAVLFESGGLERGFVSVPAMKRP